MMGKIEWYREVLELEPGSKIFFPLAKLLVEKGLTEEAVSTLRKGVSYHPEFFEARLLLVELLYIKGDTADCSSEVARLAGLFRNYPAFWDAWSDGDALEEKNRDLSVALAFIGALMRQDNLTLVEVLKAGLDSLRGQPKAHSPETAGEEAAQGVELEPTPEAASPDFPAAPVIPPVFAEPEPAFEEEPLQPSNTPARVEDSAQAAEESPLPAASLISSHFANAARMAGISPAESTRRLSEAAADVPEKCSLRTRSMAEVLAEQGDIRASIDIYEELLAAATPHQRPAIEQRLKELKGTPDRVTLAMPVTSAHEEELLSLPEVDLSEPATDLAEMPAAAVFAPGMEAVAVAHPLDLAPLAGEALLSLDDTFIPPAAAKSKSSSKSMRLLEKLALRLENRARQ